MLLKETAPKDFQKNERVLDKGRKVRDILRGAQKGRQETRETWRSGISSGGEGKDLGDA